MAALWAIDVIWTTFAKYLVPAFGQDALKTIFFGPMSKVVVVAKLGIAEDLRLYAK